MLQRVVLIDDDLDESYALAFHRQMSSAGGHERTPIGQLVREAKPYDQAGSPGDPTKARLLAAHLAEFVREHPTYQRANLMLAVPPSNPNKAFDLPTLLAEEIARATGQSVATAGLRKTRDTRPMKACRTIKEKIDNLSGAFVADPSVFRGQSVVIVDDVYETGFSLNEVGRTVRQAGAALVLGLAATKTARDLGEWQDPAGVDDVISF
jgi:predicted amidophosphoribosyltransferase